MGLRQGSVLSPILFILYTASLLQQLNELEVGVNTGHDLFHRLCAIMFVDDLFTLATSLDDLTLQIATIQNWALQTHSVISFEKSTITTSPLTDTQLSELKAKCPNIEHTNTTVHLGMKVNLEELLNGYKEIGTDVAHRAGKTKGILGTMGKKGLKDGAVAPLPAIHIISTTALASLTYGLSCPHLTFKDLRCLANTMADGITTLVGLSNNRDMDESLWLLHDTGITPPATLISINDSTTLILAKEGLTDFISAAILPMDTALTNAVCAFLASVDSTEDQVRAHKRGERTRFLISKARSAFITEQAEPFKSLCLTPSPILLSVTELHPSDQTALIRARFFFCHPPSSQCKFCDVVGPHSIQHAAWHCDYFPLSSRRSTTTDHTMAAAILNGHQVDINDINHSTLRHLLNQLSWSPHFYPRI
jgi:hypothetical protein